MHNTRQTIVLFVFIFAGFFVSSGNVAFAQLLSPFGLDETISITVSPTTPYPEQAITLTAESFAIDLSEAEVTWFEGSSVLARGQGLIEVFAKTGVLGSVTEFGVLAEIGGKSIAGNILVRPTFVDLIWQADTYTPPLYRGKALISPGSDAEIYARTEFVRPNGSRVPEQEIVYRWSVNDEFQERASGVGQSIFPINNFPVFDTQTIRLDAQSRDGVYRALALTNLTTVTPSVLIYEQDPLLGQLFNRAFGSLRIFPNQERSVFAEPYFFSATHRDDSRLLYTWYIDGEQILLDGDSQSALSVSNTSKEEGAFTLRVLVEGATHFAQQAISTIELFFSNE